MNISPHEKKALGVHPTTKQHHGEIKQQQNNNPKLFPATGLKNVAT